MILELVETLLRGVQGSTVTEIEYEADGQRLRIVRVPHSAVSELAPEPVVPAGTSELPTPKRIDAVRVVNASMHGTFFRSATPGAPPIVDVGDVVQAGQQLALLEAMKMLHAVESEWAGRIRGIFVEDGVAVEPGSPLFELEVAGPSDV